MWQPCCSCTQAAHHPLSRCDPKGEPSSGRTEAVQAPAGGLVGSQDSSMHSRLSDADGEVFAPGGWHSDGTANVYATSGRSSPEGNPRNKFKGVQRVMCAHFPGLVCTNDEGVWAPSNIRIVELCVYCVLHLWKQDGTKSGYQECWCTMVHYGVS